MGGSGPSELGRQLVSDQVVKAMSDLRTTDEPVMDERDPKTTLYDTLLTDLQELAHTWENNPIDRSAGNHFLNTARLEGRQQGLGEASQQLMALLRGLE
jgi:hypothetical protein